MRGHGRQWSRWLVQLLSWDGLLPLGCWGAIWVVQLFFIQRRGIVELTAVILPTAAFIVRMIVGWRSFQMDREPLWIRSRNPWLRGIGTAIYLLRVLFFFLGLIVLGFLDSMVILRPLILQWRRNPDAFLGMFILNYAIYLACMAMATAPVWFERGKKRVSSQPLLPVAAALGSAARAGRLRPTDWRCWAEEALAAGALHDPWLASVAQAESVEELYRTLAPRLLAERVGPAALIRATLGHLWMRYQKGELTLAEFLHQAAELCRSELAPFDAQEFDLLAEELKRSGAEHVRAKLNRMLSAVQRLARKQWNLLRRFADVLP